MKIALAQMSMQENREKNLDKALAYIREASQNQADLILFPEVMLTEFFAQRSKQEKSLFSFTLNDKPVERLCCACKKYNIMAAANIYLEHNGLFFDSTLLIDRQGEIIGTQDMVHVPSFPGFYEQDYYEPSQEGFKVFDTEFGKIGIVVCFDRHLPESIRTEALMGADLILIPTANIKDEPLDLFEWEIRVQAFHNSVFIAMCNRTGKEGEMDFCGQSLVCSPSGDLIVKANDDPGLFFAQVDLQLSQKQKEISPYLCLRREEFYR